MTCNSRVSVDLANVLNKISTLNYICFHNPKTIIDELTKTVYIKLRESQRYPYGLLRKYKSNRRTSMTFNNHGYGVATPFAADVLMACPEARDYLREMLLEELDRFE